MEQYKLYVRVNRLGKLKEMGNYCEIEL